MVEEDDMIITLEHQNICSREQAVGTESAFVQIMLESVVLLIHNRKVKLPMKSCESILLPGPSIYFVIKTQW